MKLLSGMIRAPRISELAVAAERGVVMAELRESNGPQKRIADATNAHLFAGQLLGDRSPIGTTESLGKASATSVGRSEEHTSELQSLMRNPYAVFCLKHKN